VGFGMFGDGAQLLIDLVEQRGDKPTVSSLIISLAYRHINSF
jgi:hypothetical protein